MNRMVPAAPLVEILERRGGIIPLKPMFRGTEYDRVRRGIRHGKLTLATADIAACRLGFHPCRIWPEWWALNHYRDDEYAKETP